MKLLVVSDCYGAAGSEIDGATGKPEFHAKGTILELDPKKKGEDKEAADLQAAGRIVPVTKENLIRCKRELEKRGLKVTKDITDALAEIEKEEKGTK